MWIGFFNPFFSCSSHRHWLRIDLYSGHVSQKKTIRTAQAAGVCLLSNCKCVFFYISMVFFIVLEQSNCIMSLIEGIGDDFLYVVILLVLVGVISLAWISTNVNQIPFPTTLFIIERRTSRRNRTESRKINVLTTIIIYLFFRTNWSIESIANTSANRFIFFFVFTGVRRRVWDQDLNHNDECTSLIIVHFFS